MKYWLSLLAFCAFFPFATLAEEKESAAEKQETTAEAQETAPAASDAMEDREGVESFDVIGSHIKKTNIEGPSPVLVIDRDQIEMSGYNSVGDILRTLPVASQGGQREAALEYPSTQSGTSLRGMKGKNVLVLMNYRRLPPVGGSNSVDLSVIPLSVIERIEILKDGASALYGSDAVGGVINIVTKKGAVGGQINIQGSLVQREEGNTGSALASFVDFWNWSDENELHSWNGKGDKFSIDASYGGNVNDINYMVGGQIRFNSALHLRDRKFSKLDTKDFSSFGNPGSWAEGKTKQPFPGCPSERIVKGVCRWDYSDYMQSTPRMIQGSVFAYADTELASDIRASTTVIYSYLNSLALLAPPPLVALATDGVPADVVKNWGLPVQGSEKISIYYRPVREKGVGRRTFDLDNHSYQAQFNIEMDLLNTMELEGNLNVAGSHYFTEASGFLSRNKLFELTNQGNFNPTLSDDNKSDVSYAAVITEKVTHSNILSFDPKLSGEIGEIAGQPLSFAVGSMAAYQRYLEEEANEEAKKIIADGDKILGGDTAVAGEGDRIFGSLYGELALQLFEMVDLQLAARTDYYHYSDSESASGFTEQDIPFLEDYTMPVSPRVALSFQPVDELKLRASWGMGFRAPSLVAIHQSETVTHPFSVDYVNCPVYDKTKTPACDRDQRVLKLSGNKELKPESSQSINLGLVFQPIKELSFNIDYFRTNRQNLILFSNDSSSLNASLRDVMEHELKKGAEALKARGVTVERDESGDISQVITTTLNSASDLVHGFDAEIDASIQMVAGWDLGLKVSHSHILYNEYQVFSDSELEVPIDWDGATWPGMPRWKNTATLSVMNKDMGHTVQFILHNIPGQRVLHETTEEFEHYWQLDLAGKMALTDNMDLIVGIENVLAFERPENRLRNTPNGYLDAYLYGVRGRVLNARLTYNFQ